jgi:hypothetical protein
MRPSGRMSEVAARAARAVRVTMSVLLGFVG